MVNDNSVQTVIIDLLYFQTAANDRRQQLETNIIPYLSLAGSAEILPTTHKVRIVLTPLQRWDACSKPQIDMDEKKFRSVCTLWRAGKITAVQAQQLLKMSASTFYRRVKKFGI